MIYVTGDPHGDFSKFFRYVEGQLDPFIVKHLANPDLYMQEEASWTADDKIIFLGDFGFVSSVRSDKKGYAEDNKKLDILSEKPYEILFLDGNHECFPELYEYPVVERYGAPVRKLRDNIYHLQRGNIYTIEDKTFFVMGGAYSVDKALRTEGISWWPEEIPSEEELNKGLENLRKAGWRVDYIITHTVPEDIAQYMRGWAMSHNKGNLSIESNDFLLRKTLQQIWDKTEFKKWYFGHWHFDIPDGVIWKYAKGRGMMNDVERIE